MGEATGSSAKSRVQITISACSLLYRRPRPDGENLLPKPYDLWPPACPRPSSTEPPGSRYVGTTTIIKTQLKQKSRIAGFCKWAASFTPQERIEGRLTAPSSASWLPTEVKVKGFQFGDALMSRGGNCATLRVSWCMWGHSLGCLFVFYPA